MSLFETIKSDAIKALKERDKFKYESLKFLIAALQNKEIEKQAKAGLSAVLTEEEIVQAILSEMKKRKESIDGYEKAQRQDSADQEKKELEIISQYAPKQLTESEIETELKTLIASLGSVETNVLMKKCAEAFRGRADMGVVSKMVRELSK